MKASFDKSSALIAFDLDDTLYEERTYASAVLRLGAEYLERQSGQHGIVALALQLFDHDYGAEPPLQAAARQVLEVDTIPWIDDAIEVMRDSKPKIQPFPDVVPLIRALAKQYTLAVVTDGRAVTQRRKLELLGVRPYFTHVVISDEVPARADKLSGVPYQILRDKCLLVGRRIMIGDQHGKDLVAAEQAGFEARIVRRPGIRYVHSTPPGITTFPDLGSALENLGLVAIRP